MKKELNATVVWIIVGAAVVIAGIVIYFGTFGSGGGAGPVVKAKPWSPAGYGGSGPGGARRPGQPPGAGGAQAAPSAPTGGK